MLATKKKEDCELTEKIVDRAMLRMMDVIRIRRSVDRDTSNRRINQPSLQWTPELNRALPASQTVPNHRERGKRDDG
jgi:hypothetical protein